VVEGEEAKVVGVLVELLALLQTESSPLTWGEVAVEEVGEVSVGKDSWLWAFEM
jgi:hypothetical protein